MKRFFLVMLGLGLIALCAGWFLGPVYDIYVDLIQGRSTVGSNGELQTVDPQALESRSSRGGGRVQRGGFDWNLVLNAANALFGLFGVMLTYKASRSAS